MNQRRVVPEGVGVLAQLADIGGLRSSAIVECMPWRRFGVLGCVRGFGVAAC